MLIWFIWLDFFNYIGDPCKTWYDFKYTFS